MYLLSQQITDVCIESSQISQLSSIRANNQLSEQFNQKSIYKCTPINNHLVPIVRLEHIISFQDDQNLLEDLSFSDQISKNLQKNIVLSIGEIKQCQVKQVQSIKLGKNKQNEVLQKPNSHLQSNYGNQYDSLVQKLEEALNKIKSKVKSKNTYVKKTYSTAKHNMPIITFNKSQRVSPSSSKLLISSRSQRNMQKVIEIDEEQTEQKQDLENENKKQKKYEFLSHSQNLTLTLSKKPKKQLEGNNNLLNKKQITALQKKKSISELTFNPQINQKSKLLMKKKGNLAPIYQRLHTTKSNQQVKSTLKLNK